MPGSADEHSAFGWAAQRSFIIEILWKEMLVQWPGLKKVKQCENTAFAGFAKAGTPERCISGHRRS